MNEDQERAFVEQTAVLLAANGLPKVYGRLLGRLMVCDPPDQSLTQLATWLDVSKGALSPALRTLVAMGRVREAPRAGREAWYRIDHDAWLSALEHDRGRVAAVRALAEAGLADMEGAPPERTQRLRDLRDLNRMAEARLTALAANWKAGRRTP
jgi:hypothetical protein